MTSEVFLVKVADVGERGLEQLALMRGEVVLCFELQHFEAIEHGLCGAEVKTFLSRSRVWDLPQKKPRILRLQKKKVVETRIGLRIVSHVGK